MQPAGGRAGPTTGTVMPSFALHPRLSADTMPVAQLSLSELRLMRDRRWPWLILVPRREVVELHDLMRKDRILLMEEIAEISAALKRLTDATKINVGALGNMVPQLHVHVIARRESDPAWPGPVWGHGEREDYATDDANAFVRRIRDSIVRP